MHSRSHVGRGKGRTKAQIPASVLPEAPLSRLFRLQDHLSLFSNLKLAFPLKVEEPSCFEDKIDEIIQTKMNVLSCIFSGHAYSTLFSNPEIGNAAH